MLDAGKHLLEMINCVLDLSQIEANRVELHPCAVDPRNIALACLDFVRPAAEAKGLALRLSDGRALPGHVMVDPTRFRQVVLNLLGNAVKFTTQGSVELRLLTTTDGEGLRVGVADTGPGIPAALHGQLFQDFERLGTDAPEGAGLGLALSARLVALMEGQLNYEPNPTGGSLFWLDLPSVVIKDDLQIEATPDSKAQPFRPLHLLVVDDVAMNREIAGAFLRAAGHTVGYAGSGAEAVEAATSSDYDAILMDVRMPGMDGLEAARRIRALADKRGHVPIIALTAQAFAEQVQECRRAGMDSHLAKPFTPEALRDAVARVVGEGPAMGPNRPAARQAALPATASAE
jgi:CheY-like chemotaxis protein